MAHALVLNATYEPLCVVPQRRALVLVLASKAIPLEGSGYVVHAATTQIDAPAVVRLVRFVKVPFRGPIPLTRRAVFARDNGRCAYCGGTAATIDHVVPRSRGGRHAWENVVAACHRCNNVKGDRQVHEMGWRLRSAPHQPVGQAWRILAAGRADPCWLPYLAAFGGELAGTASATA